MNVAVFMEFVIMIMLPLTDLPAFKQIIRPKYGERPYNGGGVKDIVDFLGIKPSISSFVVKPYICVVNYQS